MKVLLDTGRIRTAQAESWRVTYTRWGLDPYTTEIAYLIDAALPVWITVRETEVEGADQPIRSVRVETRGSMPPPTAALVAEVLAEVSAEGYRPEDNAPATVQNNYGRGTEYDGQTRYWQEEGAS